MIPLAKPPDMAYSIITTEMIRTNVWRYGMTGYKLGVIGLGRMGSGIIEAIIANKVLEPGRILAFDPDVSHCGSVSAKGVAVASGNTQVTQMCPMVLLAVKPQKAGDVLAEIQHAADGTCFISIMAGISSGYIKSKLPDTTYVITVMPNTPLIVGKAATVVAKAADIPLEIYNAAVSIFSCAGDVVFMDEEHINACIPLSSSSPAFFYRMAREMVKYAGQAGIDPAAALRLAAQAMEGAAVMLKESGKPPDELIAQVASPGGTTLAALEQMDRLGFDNALFHAMTACKNRADELSKG